MNRRRALSYCLAAPFTGASLLALGRSARASVEPSEKRALLIAGSQLNESAMHEDQVAVYRTLRQRGFAPQEIACLDGPISRTSLFEFVREMSRPLAGRPCEVFLHYSGCGTHRDRKPALDVGGDMVLWDEVFTALKLAPEARLTLLADCCLSNLLQGNVPANGTALVMAPTPGNDLKCIAANHTFIIDGSYVRRGVISYYAARALESAASAADWMQRAQALCDEDVARGVLPKAKRIAFALAGKSNGLLPGKAVK
jgi:hypothetical protein